VACAPRRGASAGFPASSSWQSQTFARPVLRHVCGGCVDHKECGHRRTQSWPGQEGELIPFCGIPGNHFDEIYQGLNPLRSKGSRGSFPSFRSRYEAWDEEVERRALGYFYSRRSCGRARNMTGEMKNANRLRKGHESTGELTPDTAHSFGHFRLTISPQSGAITTKPALRALSQIAKWI